MHIAKRTEENRPETALCSVQKKLRRIMALSSDRGAVSIVVALVITVLMGFASLVVDIGSMYLEKTRLQNALDAAALAASIELPERAASAMSVAQQYLTSNKVDLASTQITIAPDGKSIEIIGTRTVRHYIAQVIGISSSTVRARSKALLSPIKAINHGIRPFAVEKFNYVYGASVTLKKGASDGISGNYGPLALGGTGADVFRDNAIYGYNGKINIGDWINTETGDMAGPTNTIATYYGQEPNLFPNYPRNSLRLWTIPLVAPTELTGKTSVQIVGFAQFYIDGMEKKDGIITGKFIRYVTYGEADASLPETGLFTNKLVK